MIKETEHFLQSENIIEVANEVTLVMYTAIHLHGKKQCIYNIQGKVNTSLIVKLIRLLEKGEEATNVNEQIKEDIR